VSQVAEQAAEDEIGRFRRGERFLGPVAQLIERDKLDDGAIRILGNALATEPEPVREEIARLLVAGGVAADAQAAAGGSMLRDRRIIEVLIDAGIANGVGLGREACLEGIRAHVPPDLIKEYAAPLVANLKRWPGPTLLLVVAKGKLENARPIVDELILTPRWAGKESTLVAKAALGDQTIERQFVDPFVSTRDAVEKARLARLLGLIGTHSALTALASELRSDLEIVIERVFRRSVRLDIIADLSYNFPDLGFLYERAIKDDGAYETIEHFAEQRFGVSWRTPRPPFLAIQGYPRQP
jgi:hypothetical protein